MPLKYAREAQEDNQGSCWLE